MMTLQQLLACWFSIKEINSFRRATRTIQHQIRLGLYTILTVTVPHIMTTSNSKYQLK